MAERDAPLVPIDLDLRDFRWMKLDLIALFNSDFNSTADDAAWRAGVTLWGKAWHQVPASSLPDDDAKLCSLAGLGRDLKTWRRVKKEAMHGFVMCTDGRLYHRFLSAMAVEAGEERDKYARRKAADRERKSVGISSGIPAETSEHQPPIPQENTDIPEENAPIPAEFQRKKPLEGAKRPESKFKIKNLRGDLGRCAPSGTDPPSSAGKAEVDATVARAVAALNGSVPKGIRDPVAYQAIVKQNKFRSLVMSLNAWVGAGLHDDARIAAWEVLARAEKAECRDGMDRQTRKAFDRLVEMSKTSANGAA